MILDNDLTPKKQRRILFLCDKRACEHCGRSPCAFTEDIRHAANFRLNSLGYFEEVPPDERAKPIL